MGVDKVLSGIGRAGRLAAHAEANAHRAPRGRARRGLAAVVRLD